MAVGTDISTPMLGAATHHPRIRYISAAAEQLPFASATFDLLTVGLAFHWFDQMRFLQQANRVLRAGGWLIVYNNYFVGKMDQNLAFEHWVRNDYLVRFPTPHRYNEMLTDEVAQASGFGLVEHEHYTNKVDFSPDQLARYLMTQTNIIAATERSAERLCENDVYSWLLNALRPLFPGARGTFQSAGTIDFVRKAEVIK
jgi:SAM-dependent methyltransferase